MAGMKFEYDENGAKFYYFILSFYAMIIIPCTYYFWPRTPKKTDPHAEDVSTFGPCIIKNQILNKDQPRKKLINSIVKIVFIVGWIVFLVLAYKVSQIEIEHKEYDPFAILGIDREASEKEIKKKYRELSKTMHPDKGGNEEAFKELTTAYRALTDQEARDNWAKYGNPDGPGVTTFGIALPKWMVEGKNSYLVLAAYVLVFMIIMPTVVGTWWYRSIRYTGDQMLIETSRLFSYFLTRSPVIIQKRAVVIIGAALEFMPKNNPEIIQRESHNQEINMLCKEYPEIQDKIKEQPFNYPYSVKARAFIYAHLARHQLSHHLLVDKSAIIRKLPFLINEAIQICANFSLNAGQLPRYIQAPKLDTFECLMRLSQVIVQAVNDKKGKNSLLQLPHLEEGHLRHFVNKKRQITTIKQFVTAKDADRRSILRHLTDEQYDDILRVCKTYPNILMEAHTKVIDDEDENTITESALVTVVVKLERRSLEELFDREDLEQPDAAGETANNNEEEATSEANEEKKKPTTVKSWDKQQKKKPKKKQQNNKQKPKAKPNAAANNANNKQQAAQQKENEESEEENSEEEEDSETEKQVQSKQDLNEDDYDNDNDLDELADDEEASPKPNKANKSKEKSKKPTTKVETLSSSEESAEPNNKKSESGNYQQEEYFEKFQKQQKKREKLEAKGKLSHRVYCPFYPDVKQECWWLYMADKKQQRLMSQVVYICNLKDSDEYELKFIAPPKAGDYTYSVFLKSDSYLDFDVVQTLKVKVLPNDDAPIDSHPQWDDLDDEADKSNAEEEDEDLVTESEDEA